MPVAVRKRSWEEHVTHPSGLQYSYDDLDLVCCHGINRDGLWVGSGALRQGRQTRCASMPEGCQLPSDDLGQTPLVEASAVDDVDESGRLRQTGNSVKLNFQESVHGLVGPDLPQRNPNSAHLPATNAGISAALCCYSNSDISSVNTSAATDDQSVKTVHNDTVIGTERSLGCFFERDVAFEGLEEQQYISISSNKGPPLSGSAVEKPGKLPTHQQTKESHTEGYSRSPEIPEVTLNRCAAAKQEPQTNCPDVEGIISTSDQAGAWGPVFALQNSADTMESGNALSLPKASLEPFLTFTIDDERDKGFTESQSAVFVHNLVGPNELETKNENEGLNHLRNVQGEPGYSNCAVALDQASDCEISKDPNLPTAAEQELQFDFPDVKGIISISDQAGEGGSLFVLQNSADTMDSGSTSSTQPVVGSSLEEQCDQRFTQSQSTIFACGLDGPDDSEALNENAGLARYPGNVQVKQDSCYVAMALGEGNDCETLNLNQNMAEQRDVARTTGNWPQLPDSTDEGEPAVAYQTKVKNQCPTSLKTVSSEHQSTGNPERESKQTSTILCAGQTSLSQSLDNMVQSSLPNESTMCKDANVTPPVENNTSKLVTIPEIRLVEAEDDCLVKARGETKADVTENPAHNTHLHNKHQATEQHLNLPFLSKEVSDGFHGNQTSGLSESPCSEVADGHRGNHSPGDGAAATGESDEAVLSAVSSDMPLSSSDVRGTSETGDQKEDSVAKVRMRKREHARLDSMVLLLMKLDQLDQEIENALSATSSMDNTPTLNRRHHLETDQGPTPAGSLALPPLHTTGAFSSGSVKSHGAKSKSGSPSVASEKKTAGKWLLTFTF